MRASSGSSPLALMLWTAAATAAVLTLIVGLQLLLGTPWALVEAGLWAKLWMAFVVATVIVVAAEMARRRRASRTPGA